MSEVEYRTINGRRYELKLNNSGADAEWPWFVNAYRMDTRGHGLRLPDWFCVGKSREDAIARITKKLGEGPVDRSPLIRGET